MFWSDCRSCCTHVGSRWAMLPALVFAASLLLVVQAEGASLNASLAVAIEAIINQPQYEGCRWGVLARRTTTEDSLDLVYESAGAHLFSVPASNNKLPTTYAAWLALGPDYAFKTSLSVDGGAGDGNATTVTLCGANDPSLTSAQLQAAAAAVVLAVPALASSSNSAVTVRVDNRRSADALFPDSWEWEDLEFDYGAPPASVILDGNTVEVVVAPGAAVGAAAAVTVPADPGSACFGVAIAATTTASAATVSSPPPPPPPPAAFSSSTAALSLSVDVVRGAVVVAVSGSISVGAPPQSFAVACRDPLRRAADVLAQALRGAGAVGAVSAADAYSVVTDAPECDDTATAATVPMFSAPLAQLLNHTLLESDNTYAEAVLRRLGADGSVAQGLAAVRTVLSNGGGGSASTPGLPVALNLNELSAADGSGLSRHGLVTPRFLAALVAGADPAFISLLPLAGVSGTLANRFVGTVAEGKLRAKTGSMSNVNALTGVVGDVAFAILSDACPQPSSNVRDGIDAIAVLFAEQSPA